MLHGVYIFLKFTSFKDKAMLLFWLIYTILFIAFGKKDVSPENYWILDFILVLTLPTSFCIILGTYRDAKSRYRFLKLTGKI
jgi:hypothetical protein